MAGGAHTRVSLAGTMRLAASGHQWVLKTVLPWFFGGEWLTVGEGITKELTPHGVGLSIDSIELAAKFAGEVPGFGGSEIVAKITAIGASPGRYQATEQIWDDSADAWINASGGYSFSSGGVGELFELNGQIGVKIGSFVRVFAVTGDDNVVNWMFAERLETYRGKITVNGGSGSYTVRRLTLDGSAYSPTTDVTATEINGMADIPVDTQVFVTTDGTTHVFWAAGFYEDGTTTDKSYADEHQEAARTGAGFTRGTDGKRFKFSAVIGEAYYHDGDEVWYEHRQDFTIASDGRFKAVGDEYRVTVDTPEVCSGSGSGS